jgi:hypothetical protein
MNSLFFIDPLKGWICGNNGLVMSSLDGGRNWNQQISGTTNSLAALHFVDGKTGWAAGAGGTILKTTNGGGQASDSSWQNSTTTVLKQNFPNPVNQSTTISFVLLDPGRTTLVVYDILGRRIETLMDQTLPAGPYSATWNASNAPTGIYLCRLEAAGKTIKTIKIVVVR